MRATPPQLDSSDLGSPRKVWALLCNKDDKFRRDPKFFERHPKLKKDMRSMLIEWLMEVCSDRKLHRETFHLCIDYLDRYLEKTKRVDPSNLQLIASSCLVIASKMEEIYPPKIKEIAEYTDGCCSEEHIRDMEEVLLQILDWNCQPITSIHWLALYLQLMSTCDVTPEVCSKPNAPKRQSRVPLSPTNSYCAQSNRDVSNRETTSRNANQSPSRVLHLQDSNNDDMFDENRSPVNNDQLDADTTGTNMLEMSYVGYTSYSEGHVYPDQRCTVPKLMRDEFVRLAMILDLVILDVESMGFKYSELAAAVVSCCYEPEHLIHQVTGFRANQLVKVCRFVEPFVRYCENLEPAGVILPHFADVHREDCHNIQIHIDKSLDHVREIKRIRIANEATRKEEEQSAFRTRKRKLIEYP
uniref:Cyclin N-terminal domain-containing protein n=1 Tax=Ditylenchus dipsaci TaxID=166011 RepID=A0A915DZ37_9BILA